MRLSSSPALQEATGLLEKRLQRMCSLCEERQALAERDRSLSQRESSCTQGVVIPYTAVVTAKTRVKKWSRGQVVLLVPVKRLKTILNSVERSRCN